MGNKIQKSVTIRRGELFKKMMKGATPTELKEYWLRKNPNKTKHTFDKDITWCYDKLDEFGTDNYEEIIKQHVIMYDRNIKDAREIGNIGAANQAMQFKEKLLGLHKPDTQINVQNNSFMDLSNISLDELRNLLDK